MELEIEVLKIVPFSPVPQIQTSYEYMNKNICPNEWNVTVYFFQANCGLLIGKWLLLQ